MINDNSKSVDLRHVARRSTVIWVVLSLPSIAIIAWLGKLKPGMPLWQWALGVYAAVQLAVAMILVRRQWVRAQAVAQQLAPPDSRR